MKFQKRFVNSCFDKIMKIISLLPENEKSNLHYIAKLVSSSGTSLGVNRVKSLYNICINDPTLHSESIFEGISTCAKESTKFQFLKNEGDLDLFCNSALSKCEKCNKFHHDILFYGYEILNLKCRKLIKFRLETFLLKEPDFNLYYLVAIKGIINSEFLFIKFLKLFKNYKPKQFKDSFFNIQGEVFHPDLNKLLNLAFKYDMIIPKDVVQDMKGMSDYYDWILDMGNFNYNKFNPLWLIQYPTVFFLKKSFGISEVRALVRKYLKTNFQPTLAEYYSAYV